MGSAISAEVKAVEEGILSAVEVLAGAGVVYGGARVAGAFLGGNVGSMVAGTSVGFGIMLGGVALAYDGVKRVWPEIKADLTLSDLAIATTGPFLLFEGALLLGQGAGLNTTTTLIGLVAQENYWLAVLGGTSMAVGALLTMDTVNQFYSFLPYGWNYRAGINIALTAGSGVLALAGAYKLANDPGFNKFDAGLMALAGAGLGYFGYKSYYEWLRYKGYVICPEDKKKHYLMGDWTNQNTYDAAIIKTTCAAQGAGLSDRDYRKEYFDRMNALIEANEKRGIYKTEQQQNKKCADGETKIRVGPYIECWSNELIAQSEGKSYKQPDSSTANTQNTTGSGLNTGNAKKAGKGK